MTGFLVHVNIITSNIDSKTNQNCNKKEQEIMIYLALKVILSI